ncbi:AI-2E family transporter [Pedobacter nanyangensis]|uniref:AI-2E family transporter n=1 Tax=Pedobacter nanyangensis TaxID=1562389 RepID=UPI001F050B1C|nr:AI-2E family transporter [Pedobacter nanyangensis]
MRFGIQAIDHPVSGIKDIFGPDRKHFSLRDVIPAMEKLQQTVYLLLFFTLGFAGLYFSAPFMVPVVLAAVLSMLFIRLCNYFESKNINRAFAALLCMFIFIACIMLILVLLSIQLSSLAENIDEMKARLFNLFSHIKHWINDTLGVDAKQQKKIIDQQTNNTNGMLLSFASGLMSIAVNAVLVLVYMYLFLLYRRHIKQFILKLVAKKEKADTDIVVHKAGKVSQKYLSGLAAMIGLLWVMYGIGFSLIGVENAIFFAVLCGLLEIVPFVGNLTGTAITVLAVLAQGGNEKVWWVLLTYFIVQFIQTYILEPLVVGEQVNINPLFTIMAIVLGEMVWGIAGMILAIPLLGMVKIICDHHPDLQPYGFLIGPENPRKRRTTVVDYMGKLFKKEN